MKIFETILELQTLVAQERKAGRRIGFVPTMGALHEGHLSLVREALKSCEVCIVSIFVNPTQFNDPKDLESYPRTFVADVGKLQKAGATAVFAPSVETIYPEKDDRVFEVGAVAEVMEGKYRPGHFNGVMQVVSRLFDIVRPDVAFFGEKDFQQVAVVRAMCRLISSPVEIVACPIVREADGLAMSSRNVRLSEEGRAVAPNIHRILVLSQTLKSTMMPGELKKWVVEQLDQIPLLRVEYYEIVDADSLQSIEEWSDADRIYGCITVFCEDVRLIDNIAYGEYHS